MYFIITALVVLLLASWAAIGLMWFTPLFTRGSAVFMAPTRRAQELVVRILMQHKVQPYGRVDTSFASRAIMRNGVIVDVVYPEVTPGPVPLGSVPTAGLMLESDTPRKSAREAAELLCSQGFTAIVQDDPDPEVGPRKMSIVRTNVLTCGMIGFRLSLEEMGSKPVKWEFKTSLLPPN